MLKANHPAEIFGYSVTDRSTEAENARQRYWCPFVDELCDKYSSKVPYPMGVCTIKSGAELLAISPRRFRENNIVFRDIALERYGDTNNLLVFEEVLLPGVGKLDFVMVRHKPFSSVIEDFICIEFQTGQTTGTGGLVIAMRDFLEGKKNVEGTSYPFGLNIYDVWKRAFTQVLVKGIVFENWGNKIYWVTQESVFTNLAKRYNFVDLVYDRTHSTTFVTYDLVPKGPGYTLQLRQYRSAPVNRLLAAFQSMALPSKDDFIKVLTGKVGDKAQLQLHLGTQDDEQPPMFPEPL